MWKYVSGLWSAAEDRSIGVEISGAVSSSEELATWLRLLAAEVESSAAEEDKLNLCAANAPLEFSISPSQ